MANVPAKSEQESGGIVAYMESIKPKLMEAATPHLHPDRLIRVFLGEGQRNPKLLQCEMSTVVAALSTCNQVGLEPGGTMGYCYLIPRRNRHNSGKMECNFQLGYKGLVELARRSGEVRRIAANVVYQWELEAGLFEYSHEPPAIRHDWSPDAPDKPDPKTIVGAYAVVETKDGQRAQIWLSRAQIEKRRQVAAAKSGPWSDWYAEMARKTALRAILSGGQVPLSVETRTAIEADSDDWVGPLQQQQRRRETRATRQVAAFAGAIGHPDALDTTAETLEGEDLTADWDSICADLAAKPDAIAKALAKAGIETPPHEWGREELNTAIESLESVMGA